MGDEEAGHPNPHTQDRNIIQKIRLLFSILQVIVCVGFLAILLGTSVRLRHQVIWILELWKWCVLMLVIVGGWILLGIMMEGVFFLTEKSFKYINVKYSYYIYGTKNHIRVLLLFISINIAWKLMVYSSHDSKILSWITSCLRALLIGIVLWVLRIFFVNLLASSFLVPNRLFPKIWKSLIDHHILYLITSSKGKSDDQVKKILKWIVKMIMKPERKSDDPVKKIPKRIVKMIMKPKNKELPAESLTVWQMRKIIEIFKICPNEFSAQNTKKRVKDLYRKIEAKARAKAAERSELQAEDKREIEPKAAERSDQLEAKDKSDDESDHDDKLLSKSLKKIFDKELGEFMVTNISGGVNPKSIGIASLRKWLVNAAKDRNSLSTYLRDANKAKKELNLVISLTVVVMTIIIWLILMGIITTQVLIVILTQCAALAFMFGDTAKKVFEGIVFVFVAHPFDVGDLCLMGNEKMVVKRISLLMTEFQKNCNDLVVYPNSALSSLNITILQEDKQNDFIYDSVKISIDRSTREDQLQALHDKIVSFSKEKPDGINRTNLKSLRQPDGEKWFKPKKKFVFKEIEDGKLNLVLDIHYRKLDFDQDNFIKSYVRDALVKKLKRLFDKEEIKYHSIQIQEVNG